MGKRIVFCGSGEFLPKQMSATREYEVLSISVDHTDFFKDDKKVGRSHFPYIIIVGNDGVPLVVSGRNCRFVQ